MIQATCVISIVLSPTGILFLSAFWKGLDYNGDIRYNFSHCHLIYEDVQAFLLGGMNIYV